MPFLHSHMRIVEEAAERAGIPQLKENLGVALLGCTAPDRRVMTREPRQDTHFFVLNRDDMGDGAAGMLQAHPHLRDPKSMGWELRSFLVGYLSHLMTDEAWIVRVYRPFFADRDALGSEPARNILDRALQFDLERIERNDPEKVTARRAKLAQIDMPLRTGFIDEETVEAWRDFVLTRVMEQEFDWPNFPRFIARFRDDPGLDQAEVERFVANPDAMFRRIFAKVPKRLMEEHREISVAATVQAAWEYLR